MRILHVVSSLSKLHGGTSEVIPNLCRALLDQGKDDVRIITCSYGEMSDAAKLAASRGVEIKEYPLSGFLGRLIRYSTAFKNDLEKNIEWADIVHLHGLWQWPCWCIGFNARLKNKPYVIMPHGFLEPERLKISPIRKWIIGWLIERRLLHSAACVIATAESEKSNLRRYGVDVDIEVVPIGLEADKIVQAQARPQLIHELGIPQDKRILLFFSRITPIKGLDLLAEAWSELSEFHNKWHLLIIGPDDRGYSDKMRALYSRLCPDNSWTIHSPIFGDDKNSLLKSVDVFVLPTRSENFSIAVQEALAAGLPVICTKGAPWAGLNGGSRWGRCGWWIDVDVVSLTAALREAVRTNLDVLHRMGAEGQKFVKCEFNWANIASKMLDVYHRILDS